MTPFEQIAPTPQTTYYSDLAAELRDLADRVEKLGPSTPRPWYTRLTFNAALSPEDAELGVPLVDALATLIDVKPAAHQLSTNTWYYQAKRESGQLEVCAQTRIPTPKVPDERDEELARLRAELARRDADQAGASFVDLDTVFPAAPARAEPTSRPGIDEPLPTLIHPAPITDPALAPQPGDVIDHPETRQRIRVDKVLEAEANSWAVSGWRIRANGSNGAYRHRLRLNTGFFTIIATGVDQ